MKKIFNKKTYGYIGFFLILCYFFYYQKSHVIDELLMIEQDIKSISNAIKVGEKNIVTAQAKIEEIKTKNNLVTKEKVDIDEVRKKIKKQIKAYNLISKTVKVNLNSLEEQWKYMDAFKAEFELVNAGATPIEIAQTLDFLGIYGVVESYKGSKVTVYVSIGTVEDKNQKPQSQPTMPVSSQVMIPKVQMIEKVEQKVAVVKTQPQATPKVEKIVQPIQTVKQPTSKVEQKVAVVKTQPTPTLKVDKIVQPTQVAKQLQIESQEKITHDYLMNTFSKTFLNAPESYYSINLMASVGSYKDELKLLEKTNMLNNAFIFSFGEDLKQYKVMLGVFKDEESAKEILEKLPEIFFRYSPRVEKIDIKQNLFHKYHTNNKIIKGTL